MGVIEATVPIKNLERCSLELQQTEPVLQITNLQVRYPGFCLAVPDLRIPRGAYGVLMGATGSGKTTLLEAVCGLRPAEVDGIWIAGKEVSRLPVQQRGIGYVPQESALFPGRRVRDQLAFSLQVRRQTSEQIAKVVQSLAGQLRIESLLDRRPESLSGGERQKVALGRALSFGPSLLLLDEPFSAVDEKSRHELVQLMEQIHRQGTTVLHVTHDHQEATRLATQNLKINENGTLQNVPTE